MGRSSYSAIRTWSAKLPATNRSRSASLPVSYFPYGWPLERLNRVEEIPPGLILVVSHEMLALPFPVGLRNYTLVTLDP